MSNTNELKRTLTRLHRQMKFLVELDSNIERIMLEQNNRAKNSKMGCLSRPKDNFEENLEQRYEKFVNELILEESFVVAEEKIVKQENLPENQEEEKVVETPEENRDEEKVVKTPEENRDEEKLIETGQDNEKDEKLMETGQDNEKDEEKFIETPQDNQSRNSNEEQENYSNKKRNKENFESVKKMEHPIATKKRKVDNAQRTNCTKFEVLKEEKALPTQRDICPKLTDIKPNTKRWWNQNEQRRYMKILSQFTRTDLRKNHFWYNFHLQYNELAGYMRTPEQLRQHMKLFRRKRYIDEDLQRTTEFIKDFGEQI
ncbi:hypothetical protein SNEBB_009807 [Seison nebaliae]|nr:hypothetical protein SNEBB_009807 [Seison nebaliae]